MTFLNSLLDFLPPNTKYLLFVSTKLLRNILYNIELSSFLFYCRGFCTVKYSTCVGLGVRNCLAEDAGKILPQFGGLSAVGGAGGKAGRQVGQQPAPRQVVLDSFLY